MRNSEKTRILRSEFALLVLLVLTATVVCQRPCCAGADRPGKASGNPELAALQDNFRVPPDDARIMVRWWWFGPAVTTQELDRELHAMKDAGIGGFEVQPVYSLTLDDPSKGLINLRYLSPQFLAAVSSTAHTAHALGLRMDMTMGSGWPYGGPHIAPDLAAEGLGCLRIPIRSGVRMIRAPQLHTRQRFLAAFVANGDANRFDASSAQRLEPGLLDGSLQLPFSPAGSRVLLIFFAAPTGQQVKRAALGAEGNVLDHYRRAALEEHLVTVGAPLAAAGEGNIRAMFCDSLEVYGADWTPGFLKEFERRRGYDLTPHLPALVADSAPDAAAIRHDWGLTLTELFNENFLAPFQAWCHQHHVLARVQAYGTPPAQLSSYRYVDLPEGEQGDEAGHWNHFTASRWASSAGHAYGKTVISAEAWTWIHGLPFRATPLDFKAMADQYFLEGINRLVGHGWPYSPPGVPEPGWHFYAAGAINAHNPWWFAMPDLALYLQRASFMLRQGRPANDIAVYLPTHDAWADLTPGHVNLWEAIWRKLGPDLLPAVLEAGYNLDLIDDEILQRDARIDGNKLAIANQQYSIVLLPGIVRIPPATLTKLGEFAKNGGILVATRRLPALAPAFQHHDSEIAEVTQRVQALFKLPSASGHFVPEENQSLEDELNRLYPPDVAFSPRTRDIGFIHRHTETAEIYFIANTSNHAVRATATFRVTGKNPEWWDLFTGEATVVQAFPGGKQGTAIPLDLEPYGSRLLVFTARPAPLATKGSTALSVGGELDLSRDWKVTFAGTGKTVDMEYLRSWTEIPGLRFFSGRATYERNIYVPGDFLRAGLQAFLDLGDPTPIPVDPAAHFQAWLNGPVREAAEVYVNGRRAGSIWHPPYQLEVTPYLHPGENSLRMVLGNTAVNEMAGSPRPNRTALTAKYGERFVDQGNNLIQPLPSGLTGRIRIVMRSRPPVVSTFP